MFPIISPIPFPASKPPPASKPSPYTSTSILHEKLTYKESNQDQELRTPVTFVDDWLNELECEFEKLIPWNCHNRLKVILSRIALKVHKDKPTSGKTYGILYKINLALII